jgi:predicted nucleic-acid-binding protein
MIALDTNVIVRVVTADDPDQLKIALAVMQSESLWICKTVILETEWVLRFTYELSREAILAAMRGILGYRALQVESRGTILQALSWYEKGLDFANALHLTSSADADRFATFDREIPKVVKAYGGADIPLIEFLEPPEFVGL